MVNKTEIYEFLGFILVLAAISAIIFTTTTHFTFDNFLALNFRYTIIALVCYATYTGLSGKPSGIIIGLALAFLYVFYYFTSRSYLETFTDDCRPIETPLTNEFELISKPLAPYAITPIDSVDDYEYNMVFENENDKEITKELRNKLMSQYPMSWTVQPPSSTHFQVGMKEGFQDASDSNILNVIGNDAQKLLNGVTDKTKNIYNGITGETKAIYNNITGGNVAPPHTDSAEEKEREILKMYKPKNANDLKTYDVEDAYKLINKMYEAKGLVPQVEHKKDTNIYEIVGTRKKGEKVTYEDEGVASDQPVAASGEETIKVPQAATDMLKDSDPFYSTQNRTRQSKHDYTKFTPGLERTFSPSYPLSQWY